MMYEIDRSRQPEEEPSLLEMVKTALNALDRATSCKKKGFFLMIEASRIDHAGHASDAAAHLFDTIMYNEVMGFVREWIDEHPDTMMMSAADHECGGLTLNGFNPLPLGGATASTELLTRKFKNFQGSDSEKRAFFRGEILPAYGLADATDVEVTTLLDASNLGTEMGNLLASRAGVNWSTGDHTASDITLHGYGVGGNNIKSDMAGNWDNTELPGYIEKALGVKMSDVTAILRANGTSWVGKRDLTKRSDADIHAH